MKQAWAGVLCATLFFLLGCAFVSYPGIETDEAMFATPLFRDWCFYSLPLGNGHRLPLMNMSYVGALKTWLYAPVFWICEPSPASIRMPAVLVGSVTILLFWFLLDRIHGRRAAVAGCVLLATDTVFLLTTTFDWGPVALQHLLTVAVMLLAVVWYQDGRTRWLGAAGFCAGLAMWDKAIFGWVLVGLCAGLLVFAADIHRRLTLRAAMCAIGGFASGALPLIVYNVAADPKFATVRSNAGQAPASFAVVFHELRSTWNGSGLFGFIMRDTTPQPNPPLGPMERVTFYLDSSVGDRWTNLMEPALVITALLLVLHWRSPARRVLVFCLIVVAVAWGLMVLSGGGTSLHHTILLWPIPIMFVSIAFGDVSSQVRPGRWLLAAALCVFAVSNLLVTNQHLYQFIRFGSTDAWSDAIYPLAASLSKTGVSQVLVTDWGIADSLCVLNRNSPPPHVIPFPLSGEPPPEADLQILADEKAVWVEHTLQHEAIKGSGQRLLDAAKQAGFSPILVGKYYDRHGQAVFQTLRFRRAQ